MKTKNIILITICLIMVGLFSFGVLAADGVPTPSEMFSDLGSFFKDIFTGSADADQGYFLVYIAYFILIMAIYVEGLKFLPLFGSKGEISTPGKWFAFAATFLSVAAIFMGEQFTGQSTGEIMRGAVAPFGAWAGVAIAGLMALIIFLALRETEMFKEHTMVGIAIALAVGLMFAGQMLSEPNLLGYGTIILVIAAIVGLAAGAAGDKWGGGGSGSGGSTSPSGDSGGKTPKEKEKDTEKGKKETEKEEKYVQREIYELIKIKKEIGKAKNGKELMKIRDHKVRKLERIERRMAKRLERLEKNGKKLAGNVPAKKTGIMKELREFKTYSKYIITVLSKGGVLDTALTYPNPHNWFSGLGTMIKESDIKSNNKSIKNFEARKKNSLTVVTTALKWDEGFYVKLKKFEKELEKLEAEEQAKE